MGYIAVDVQGGNINTSDAPPASTGQEISESKVT